MLFFVTLDMVHDKDAEIRMSQFPQSATFDIATMQCIHIIWTLLSNNTVFLVATLKQFLPESSVCKQTVEQHEKTEAAAAANISIEDMHTDNMPRQAKLVELTRAKNGHFTSISVTFRSCATTRNAAVVTTGQCSKLAPVNVAQCDREAWLSKLCSGVKFLM